MNSEGKKSNTTRKYQYFRNIANMFTEASEKSLSSEVNR